MRVWELTILIVSQLSTDDLLVQLWSHRRLSRKTRSSLSTSIVIHQPDPSLYIHSRHQTRQQPNAAKMCVNCPIAPVVEKTFQVKFWINFSSTKSSRENLSQNVILNRKVSCHWKKRPNWFSSHSKTPWTMFTTKPSKCFSIPVSDGIQTDVKFARLFLFLTNGRITVWFRIFMLMATKSPLTPFRKLCKPHCNSNLDSLCVAIASLLSSASLFAFFSPFEFFFFVSKLIFVTFFPIHTHPNIIHASLALSQSSFLTHHCRSWSRHAHWASTTNRFADIRRFR